VKIDWSTFAHTQGHTPIPRLAWCRTCGWTQRFVLPVNRDAWRCLWDGTVTSGSEACEAGKLG
jgi:hypothetical protein